VGYFLQSAEDRSLNALLEHQQRIKARCTIKMLAFQNHYLHERHIIITINNFPFSQRTSVDWSFAVDSFVGLAGTAFYVANTSWTISQG